MTNSSHLSSTQLSCIRLLSGGAGGAGWRCVDFGLGRVCGTRKWVSEAQSSQGLKGEGNAFRRQGQSDVKVEVTIELDSPDGKT